MSNTTTKRAARLFHLTLAATGSLAAAARAAEISLAEARRLRAQPAPEGLAAAPCAAREVEARQAQEDRRARQLDEAVAALEEEAVRRALFGVAEPVFHQGRECGSKAKHSDALLIFLLKTLRPERYGPATRRAEEGGDEGAGESEGPGVLPLCVDFGGEAQDAAGE